MVAGAARWPCCTAWPSGRSSTSSSVVRPSRSRSATYPPRSPWSTWRRAGRVGPHRRQPAHHRAPVAAEPVQAVVQCGAVHARAGHRLPIRAVHHRPLGDSHGDHRGGPRHRHCHRHGPRFGVRGAVISIVEGGFFERLRGEMRIAGVVAPLNAMVAAAMVAPTLVSPWLAIMSAVPLVAFWALFRGYGNLEQRYRDLDALHGFVRKVGPSLDLAELAGTAAAESRDSFARPQVGCVVFDEVNGNRRHDVGDPLPQLPTGVADHRWAAVFAHPEARLLDVTEASAWGLERLARSVRSSSPPSPTAATCWACWRSPSATGPRITSDADRRGSCGHDGRPARTQPAQGDAAPADRVRGSPRRPDRPPQPLVVRAFVDRRLADMARPSRTRRLLFVMHDRPRPVQGGQRHARPPRRRRAARSSSPNACVRRCGPTTCSPASPVTSSPSVPAHRRRMHRLAERAGATTPRRPFDARRARDRGHGQRRCGARSSATTNDASTLLRHADIAMYNAKNQRTGVELYRDEIDRRTPARLVDARRPAQRARARRPRRCTCSPSSTSPPASSIGAEALVRWTPSAAAASCRRRSSCSVAEDTGLIKQLTDLVLDRRHRAARRAARPRPSPRPRRQPVDPRPARRAARRPRAAPPRPARRRPGAAHARDHRVVAAHRRPRARATIDRAAPSRRPPVDRRLRHRLLVAQLPAPPAGERAEDRPQLRRATCCSTSRTR